MLLSYQNEDRSDRGHKRALLAKWDRTLLRITVPALKASLKTNYKTFNWGKAINYSAKLIKIKFQLADKPTVQGSWAVSSSSILISPFDITAAFFHRHASRFIIASWKYVIVSVEESILWWWFTTRFTIVWCIYIVYRLFVVAFRRSFYYEYLPVLYGFDAAIYWSARGNACLRINSY